MGHPARFNGRLFVFIKRNKYFMHLNTRVVLFRIFSRNDRFFRSDDFLYRRIFWPFWRLRNLRERDIRPLPETNFPFTFEQSSAGLSLCSKPSQNSHKILREIVFTLKPIVSPLIQTGESGEHRECSNTPSGVLILLGCHPDGWLFYKSNIILARRVLKCARCFVRISHWRRISNKSWKKHIEGADEGESI